MSEIRGKLTVNGREVDVGPVRRGTTLLEYLRNNLELTGTKMGCNEGSCGACTVLVEGEALASCITPLEKVLGATVLTIEGLGSPENLHVLQEAFIAAEAVQCGFCTPGMLISAAALLKKNPNPDEEEIITALSGNMCRCGSYKNIITAVKMASE